MIGAGFGTTLTKAREGDEAAFACLYRDLQPALLRYLQVLAPQGADDVASEAWLRVVAGLTGFSGGEQAFRAWVFTIARHRAIDAGRSAARRPTVPLVPGASADLLTAPDAADLALERISTQAVLALVSALPPDQAEIIMLRVVAGLDNQTVGTYGRQEPGRRAGGRAPRPSPARRDGGPGGCNGMSRPGASAGEIPGFPRRREPVSGLGEPLLDALLGRPAGVPGRPGTGPRGGRPARRPDWPGGPG